MNAHTRAWSRVSLDTVWVRETIVKKICGNKLDKKLSMQTATVDIGVGHIVERVGMFVGAHVTHWPLVEGLSSHLDYVLETKTRTTQMINPLQLHSKRDREDENTVMSKATEKLSPQSQTYANANASRDVHKYSQSHTNAYWRRDKSGSDSKMPRKLWKFRSQTLPQKFGWLPFSHFDADMIPYTMKASVLDCFDLSASQDSA